jgi:hypothetical protein
MKPVTHIHLGDPRLTRGDQHLLREIASRLTTAAPPRRRPPPELPEAYARELDRVFGSCGEEGKP